MVNGDLAISRTALIDNSGTRRMTSPTFGAPRKVVGFRLVGRMASNALLPTSAFCLRIGRLGGSFCPSR